MFPNSNPLSFTKILSGISKSLNIVNQIIPLYENTKPMINNARKAFSILKEINFNNITQNPKTPAQMSQRKIATKSSYHNNPTFFN